MYATTRQALGSTGVYTVIGFPRRFHEAADSAGGKEWSDGRRYWQDETASPTQNWDDSEKYPWPKPEGINYGPLEYLNSAVPEGMKISSNLLGIFDVSTWLMGVQNFALALYDQPDLVQAIVQRVADLQAGAVRHAVTVDNVEMVVVCDDMGYNKGTLVKPEFLREYVLPHHRRLADIAHAAGKICVLHSCGNLTAIMDDLIEGVGIDGKHYFQDNIMPVEEVHRRWGARTSILGGVDMDLSGRGTPEQVRARTREILDACASRGTGYSLGSGNTIATYVPIANYLAMLEEGRR